MHVAFRKVEKMLVAGHFSERASAQHIRQGRRFLEHHQFCSGKKLAVSVGSFLQWVKGLSLAEKKTEAP